MIVHFNYFALHDLNCVLHANFEALRFLFFDCVCKLYYYYYFYTRTITTLFISYLFLETIYITEEVLKFLTIISY